MKNFTSKICILISVTTLSIFIFFSCKPKDGKSYLDKPKEKYEMDSISKALVEETDSLMKSDSIMFAQDIDDPANTFKGWTYTNTEDKMNDSKTISARLRSDNMLNFDFPNQGGSVSILNVRKRRGNLEIFVTIVPSQLTFDYNNEFVKVKFDNEKSKNYSILKSADGSSDVFFFASAKKILKNIKKSNKMLVECVFYNNGIRIIEFSIANLKFE